MAVLYTALHLAVSLINMYEMVPYVSDKTAAFFFLIYFERERERTWQGQRERRRGGGESAHTHTSRGREREEENPKQALYCQH